MKKSTNLVRYSSIALAIAAMVSVAACAKKPKPEDSVVPGSAGADENQMGDSDSGKAMGLHSIHYPYDSFSLDSKAKEELKANAEILKSKPSLKIQIEGHCDQRGGIQYNIALGEKRANAAKKFLVSHGVNGEQLTTISFGKEHPLDAGLTEEAYSKNRRANFAVTSN